MSLKLDFDLIGIIQSWARHPSFWPKEMLQIPENDTGLPWETTQLNKTEDFRYDYTYLNPDDPPKFIPFQFEILDWKWWCTFTSQTWYLPVLAGVVYLMVIFGLEKFMKTRKALNLKWPLFVWNSALAIFSIAGFVRFAPEFFYILMSSEGSLYRSICYRNGGNYPAAFWGLMFVLSKYAELGDTVLIVLRKRPLQFIQWFHHFVTMSMTWIISPLVEPIQRWYVVMNYFVHSWMYSYFALKAIGVHVPRKISLFITTCQLTQMLIGLLVNVSTALLIQMGVPCYRHPFSIKLSMMVYGVFTVLFAKLFFDVSFGSKKHIQNTNRINGSLKKSD